MENYGNAIKRLRKRSGYTQRELAEKLGVSNQVVSKWETGINQPDISTISLTCEVFGISVDDFIRIARGENPNGIFDDESGLDVAAQEISAAEDSSATSIDSFQADHASVENGERRERGDSAPTQNDGKGNGDSGGKKKSFAPWLAAIISVSTVLLATLIVCLCVFVPMANRNKALTAEEIYKKVDPAVFFIRVETEEGEKGGSGFFIDNRGTAVTNYHVIEGGLEAEVTLQNGRTYAVEKILGKDKYSDLVVIKVDITFNRSVALANSTAVATGDRVYTIGYPQSFAVGVETSTFTEGIVSKSSFTLDGVDYIQTNADITNGNSGGVLLNDKGQVIGITTGALDIAGVNYMNLALPSNNVNRIEYDYDCSLREFTESYKNYTVSYRNGDELYRAERVLSGDVAPQIAAPTAGKGFVFSGWYKDELCTIAYDFNVKVEGDITLYAGWRRVAYVISFERGGTDVTGTMSNVKADYGQGVNLPENTFEKAEYAFVGWSFGDRLYEDGAWVENLSDTDGATCVLTAVWEKRVYQFVFSANGGTGANPQSLTCGKGEYVTLPECPYTRTGYTFVGWRRVRDQAEIGSYESGDRLTTDGWEDGVYEEKLEAVWSENRYTLAFESGASDAEGSKEALTLTYSQSFLLPENTYKRSGMMMTGWRGSNGITYAENVSVSGLTAADGDTVTLTAVWETLQYDVLVDYGGSKANETFKLTYGGGFVFPNPGEYAGYTFLGWVWNDGDYNAGERVKNLVSYEGESATVRAEWLARQYTVQYYREVGVDIEETTETFIYDSGYTLPTRVEWFNDVGYKITGWKHGNTVYEAGSKAPAFTESTVSLEAVIEPIEFTTVIRVGDNEADWVWWTHKYGEDVLETLAYWTVYKKGMYADTYTILNDDGTAYTGDPRYVTAEEGKIVYLEPNWQENTYTIVLINGDLTSADSTLEYYTVKYSEEFTMPVLTKEGYAFAGWKFYRCSDWTVEYEPEYQGGEVVSKLMEGGKNGGYSYCIEYQAVWQANSYTLKYDGNGATVGNMPDGYGESDKELVLAANMYKKSGYYFGGWTYGDEVYRDGETVSFLVVTDGTVITLKALWLSPLKGEGTQASPYLVGSYNDLKSVSAYVNGVDGAAQAYYRLSSDINCLGQELRSIGTPTVPFRGVFDGNGYVIKNAVFAATQKSETEYYKGLFGYVTGTLTNIGIEDYVIGDIQGTLIAAPLVCEYNGWENIVNCYASGAISAEITETRLTVSGLVGILNRKRLINCYAGGEINVCYNMLTTVSFDYYVGGMIGNANGNDETLVAEYSYADVDITVTQGENYDTSVSYYAKPRFYLGGFTGGHGDSYRGYEHCVAIGDIYLQIDTYYTYCKKFVGSAFFDNAPIVYTASDSKAETFDGSALATSGTVETLANLSSHTWVAQNVGFSAEYWAADSEGKPMLKAFIRV